MPSDFEADELAAAERSGDPYLLYHDSDERQRIVSLPETWARVTIGRSLSADVVLSWDEDVSRIHADLQRMGSEWVVVDDGLSRNGTYVNDERIDGRRMLHDGDKMRIGATVVHFKAPFQGGGETRIRSVPELPPEPGPDEGEGETGEASPG